MVNVMPLTRSTIGKSICPTLASENQGDSDKAIYGFKFYKISIIIIRITYHQIKVDINA